MNGLCSNNLRMLVVAMSILLSGQSAYSENPKPFCAVPLSEVLNNSPKKSQLDTLVEKGHRKAGDTKLWPTKTIPIVVDTSFGPNDEKVFKDALKDIEAKTGFTFLKCSADTVLNDPEILGYANLMSSKKAGCPLGTSCVRGAGFFEKTHEVFKQHDAQVLRRGRSIGIGSDKPVVIAHELLHLLGVDHTHRNPAAKDYLIVENQKESNCTVSEDGTYSDVYDPASIMHYDLPGTKCRTTLKGCSFSAPDKYGIRKISGCPLETHLKTALVCAYTGPGGKPLFGNACFRFPKRIAKGDVLLETDFKGGECISIIDQSLVYSLYNDKDDDAFKIKDKCTAF